MKIMIANAFSLSMLDRDTQRNRAGDAVYDNPRIPRPIDSPAEWLAECDQVGVEVGSVVGHADAAAVFSSVLGRPVAVNRVSVQLDHDVLLLIGQYIGPRLPEGATTLPEGALIEWWIV